MTATRLSTLIAAAAATSLLLAVETPRRSAQAQALAPMMGASAIQGTLQTVPASAAPGSLDRGRSAAEQLRAANQQRTAAISAIGGSGSGAGNDSATSAPSRAGTPSSATAGMSSARVNGQAIPICTHGAPCHAAIRRAMLMAP
jgi:hypothetical protein